MSEENISSDVELVRNSLEYYDKNTELYKKYIDKINYVKFKQSNNDYEHNYIHMYDVDKKELFSSRFEYIGMYEPQVSIWTWAWAIPSFVKKNTNIIRKILMYGTELEPEQYFLKSELITSRFRINNNIQLDMHASIASYLSKKPIIFRMKQYKNISVDNNLIDIQNPVYFKSNESTNNDSNDFSNNEYIEYFIFLLDIDNIKK